MSRFGRAKVLVKLTLRNSSLSAKRFPNECRRCSFNLCHSSISPNCRDWSGHVNPNDSSNLDFWAPFAQLNRLLSREYFRSVSRFQRYQRFRRGHSSAQPASTIAFKWGIETGVAETKLLPGTQPIARSSSRVTGRLKAIRLSNVVARIRFDFVRASGFSTTPRRRRTSGMLSNGIEVASTPRPKATIALRPCPRDDCRLNRSTQHRH